jgi:vacuolar-type H+-ATPase subunit E/Vma4
MDEVMLRNNRYKAEQSVEKARARVREATHAIWDARHFTKGHKAERIKETVQGAYEKLTESVDDVRSQTARAKERSQDMAADLQEYTSGGLDVSASMNREYHQEAMHRFENGTRLKDLILERVGAAGVPSQGRGR